MTPPRRVGVLSAAWLYTQYGIVSAVILAPIVWTVLSSFKPSAAVTGYPPAVLFSPTLENYERLFTTVPLLHYGLNSVIIAGGSTFFGLLLAVPAAFAVSWYQVAWPASLALVARMAPGGLFLLPWYVLFTRLHLINTYTALILTHAVITMPVVLWTMISFFDAIPRDVLESSLVDGSTLGRTIASVAIPLAAPGVVVATVLSFILSWNYFLFALVLSGINTTPLTVAAFQFVGEGVTDWGMLMGTATLLALPPLALAFLVQQWLVAGLTFGAVKG
ncbi:MAG TPA: carbohydrate ABC transporter permease [bacterium]|nr:carbohydrate ABC transporter permease [bacterium]